ncbi:hypothetical protein B0H13DRAFT_2361664 [Mycena leptocephala]|nr:hypothetical protein B0H13DRAFT_2361664 [Mycena leptocephala]
MSERVLECGLMGGDHDGETILIPRISLTPSNTTDFTFKFSADNSLDNPSNLLAWISGFLSSHMGSSEQAKFLFVGDIKELRLLEALDLEAPEPSWTINPCHGSLFMSAARWQRATKLLPPSLLHQSSSLPPFDAKRAAEAAHTIPLKSLFPLIACIPDSHRFKDGKMKPTPYANRYCGFSGYLPVDTIAFLGNVVATAPSAKSTPVQSTSQASGSSTKKPRWSYPTKTTLGKRKDNNDGAPSSSPSPATGI